MTEHKDWGADTMQQIAEEASRLGLAGVDGEGRFEVRP
jgi:hypothetical protein